MQCVLFITFHEDGIKISTPENLISQLIIAPSGLKVTLSKKSFIPEHVENKFTVFRLSEQRYFVIQLKLPDITGLSESGSIGLLL